MARVLRGFGQAVVYLGIAVLLGVFANGPTYQHFPPDQALIRISVVHSAQRKEECRRLTAQEIAELAPNMRKAVSCARERSPILLEVTLDGRNLLRETLLPTGFSSDGPARLYRGIAVAPGPHRLVLGMRDSPRTEGFDYTYDDVVDLRAQQNLVVDFRAESGGFILR